MKKTFYVTTPIYYVNDSPHLGHAYTTIACDVLARFKRLDGYQVMFLTGTDEHGQKVDKAAKGAGVDPQQFTDTVSLRFRNLVATGENLLNISNDDFIRTTEIRHKKAAQAFWTRLQEKGHIYLDTYAGWYSVRDEAYYAESELIDGKAPSGAEVEWVEEKSYFFDLSKWQKALLDFYDAHPDFVVPASRYNEVKSFVRGGKEYVEGALKDLSISRTTFQWGIPVPGEEKHVMYVWIDALMNYLTVLGYPDEQSTSYQDYWVHASHSPIHIVGKDIIRFHAVYWPALLMAAGLPLPKKIVAHGWWTIEGEKMSKSIGNVISPQELVQAYGLDQTRYFLMREVPFGSDGDFSRAHMVARINADLANNIGNLAQRTLSMIQKQCEGKVPVPGAFTAADEQLLEAARVTLSDPASKRRIEEHIEACKFDLVLKDIIAIASKANEYIDEQAPWKLKKDDPARMATVLYVLAESLRCLGIMLQPFMPGSAEQLLNQLAVASDRRSFQHLTATYALEAGVSLPTPVGIFPRLVEQEEARHAG